jgi:thiol:disulfide interchange protein/DsbC/DsbD-like thiol-disulfide interchange protein
MKLGRFSISGWRRPPFAFLALVLLLGSRAGAFAAARATSASLISESAVVAAGSSFTVAVRLELKPGWHIYWANPGESGIPTEIAWHLPEGFTAGGIEWPIPDKHIEEGNVLTYGYEKEVLLLVPISAPPALAPGARIHLAADVSWLECATTCVPGEAKVELTIEGGAASAESKDAPLIRSWRKRLPRPSTADEAGAQSVKFDGASMLITIPGVLPGSDFYPLPSAAVVIGRPALSAGSDGATITMPLTFPVPCDSALVVRGIVVLPAPGHPEGREVAAIIPAEVSRRLSAASGQAAGSSILDRTFTPVGGTGGEGPVWAYLLFALLGGLLLNVMPCVLPVIALKVFGLVKMAGDRPERVRRLGWSFSGGILASFAALALIIVLLKVAGQQVGWGFQFQEPLFVIAMAAVVFAFGLSLFGVFEIRVPGVAVNSISASMSRKEEGGGYVSSFSEGVFATVLATPCTAPFLGSALGFAFTQPWWAIILIFLVVGFGMALPYLLLTARPTWQRFLPRPGEWMETAKQFMGFLMMATLLWLLYVLGKQLGMEGVIWTGAFLLSVGVAAWLIGRFATLTASAAKSRIVWLSAAAIVVLGYLVFLESALNIRSVIAGAPEPAGSVVSDAGGIAWKPFSREALNAALASDRPVFVDFTAEWCLTCKVNERTALRDEAVRKAFLEANVEAFKADWTSRNPEITSLLAKFGRSGVPLYVIFPVRDRTAPAVLPEVITPDIVREAVEKAASR